MTAPSHLAIEGRRRVRKLVVGITGASGALYAKRLLAHLDAFRRAGGAIDVAVCISRTAEEVWRLECSGELRAECPFPIWEGRDYRAPFASGSAGWDGMIVVPCSMSTVARIAHGVSDSLLTRAADVMLKERRTLLLVPRETPLSAVHLDNLARVAGLGALVLPAMPSFYGRPSSVEALVDTVLARALDHLGIPAEGLASRWGEPSGGGAVDTRTAPTSVASPAGPSTVVARALRAAGLADLIHLDARNAARATPEALRARVRAADLLAVGALADLIRAQEVGDGVRLTLVDGESRNIDRAAAASTGLPNETPSTSGLGAQEPRGMAFLREVAEHRIVGPAGATVCVDFNVVGIEVAQVALCFGANEWRGEVRSKRGLPIADDDVTAVGKKSQWEPMIQTKRRELAELIARAGRTVLPGDELDASATLRKTPPRTSGRQPAPHGPQGATAASVRRVTTGATAGAVSSPDAYVNEGGMP